MIDAGLSEADMDNPSISQLFFLKHEKNEESPGDLLIDTYLGGCYILQIGLIKIS